MTKLLAVYKGDRGFGIIPLTVKALDMKDISKTCTVAIPYSVINYELFAYSTHYKEWKSIAQYTGGRGWTRVSVFVDNWEQYAVPSWVKHVKGNPYYFEKGL